MSDRMKYGKGRGSLEVTGDLKETLERILEDGEPVIMRTMKKELQAMKEKAEKEWPVRAKDSQGSAKKFRTMIRIIPPATVEGSIQNDSQYAYSVRASKKFDSKNQSGAVTRLKPGKRAATVLLFEPAEKMAEEIAKEIAKKLF